MRNKGAVIPNRFDFYLSVCKLRTLHSNLLCSSSVAALQLPFPPNSSRVRPCVILLLLLLSMSAVVVCPLPKSAALMAFTFLYKLNLIVHTGLIYGHSKFYSKSCCRFLANYLSIVTHRSVWSCVYLVGPPSTPK